MSETGVDVATFPDLDVSGANVTGNRAIAECFLRKLQSDPEQLPYANSDECVDLRTWLSRGLVDEQLFELDSVVFGIAVSDERVNDAEVTSTLTGEGIELKVVLEPAEGPSFSLSILIDATTVAILNEDI
jgi:hypothetical protein